MLSPKRAFKVGVLSLFLLVQSIHLSEAKENPEIFASTEYPHEIYSVAFHPGGKYILSGGMGYNLRLWDVETGREIRTFLGHSDHITSMVTSIAFSPDGRYAVTGCGDESLRLWTIPEGKEIRKFQSPSGIVRSVAVSPDGRHVLSGSHDQTVRLWDIETGKEIRTFAGHKSTVRSVAFSPDGRLAVSGGEDERLILWDVETGKVVKTFSGHTSMVSAVAFNQDGKSVLSGSHDKTLKLWDIETGREFKTFTGHSANVSSVAFTPDGRHALSGSWDRTLKLWDIVTGREVRRFQGHSQGVTSVAFSPDGKYILSGSGDKTLKLWEKTTGREVRRYQGYLNAIRLVAASPDGRYLISGAIDTTLRTTKFWESTLTLWDRTTGREVQRIQRFTGTADPADYRYRAVAPRSFIGMPDSLSVAFSPDGKYLLSAAEDSPITLREIATGKDVRFFLGHDNVVPSLTFSPDGKYALSGSLDETVRLWEIATGGMVRLFRGRPGIIAVAFGPGGKSIFAVARDATVTVWDLSTGKENRSFRGYFKFIRSASFSRDGKYVLLGAHDSTIKLLDVETGTESKTFSGPSGVVTSVAISPDGKHAVSGSSDGAVRLWDIAAGKLIMTLTGHSGEVSSVIFSPDGKTIISGSDDGTLRIWDAATGAETVQLLSFTNGEWMAITPEGYFNPSKEGARLVNVRIGNLVYSMESFFERFFSPFFVGQVLGNKKPALISDIRKGAGTPPRVRIVKPEKDGSTTQETIPLIVEARDTGGGVDEIRLYHNGVVSEGKEKAEQRKTETDRVKRDGRVVQKFYEVTLVPGDNFFKAVGFSTDRTESDPYEIRVRQTGGRISADLHVFVCGVNDYKNRGVTLDFGISGAKGTKELFDRKWKNPLSLTHVPVLKGMEGTAGAFLFRNIHVTELYEKDATKERILTEVTKTKTNPQDVLILYIAGQARSKDEEWYFLPYDASPLGKEENLKEKGLSFSEISEAIRSISALKKAIFFDVYKYGGSKGSVFGNLEDSRSMALLARSTGAYVILGSTHQTGEAGITKLGQSLFAHVILQGLKGEAESPLHVQIPLSDYSSRDKIVTAKSLANYLEKSLAGVSEKYKQEPRYPLIYQGMHDFPLVINKWNE